MERLNLEKKKDAEIKRKSFYYNTLAKGASDKILQKYERKLITAIRKIEEKYQRIARGKPARKIKEVTLTKYMQQVQLYVRLRDTDINGMGYCISCNKPLHYKQGDGGHYISRTYKVLIDNLDNIHLQCKGCNKKMSTKSKESDITVGMYRTNLIKKIGKPKVLWLEKEAERTKHHIVEVRKGYYTEKHEYYKNLNKELESKKRPLLV